VPGQYQGELTMLDGAKSKQPAGNEGKSRRPAMAGADNDLDDDIPF
jgi:hypothetical protein